MSIYISASGLLDYISCNRKSYYRIFKPIEPVKSLEQIRGTVVHKVLQEYWQDHSLAMQNIPTVAKQFGLQESELDNVRYFVHNFFDSFYGYVKDGDLIEHNFKLKLDNDVYLVGVFDRISDGKVFDWKTTKKTPANLSGNIQFIVYNYAYNKLFNSKPVAMYYASLNDRKLVMYYDIEAYSNVLLNELIPSFIKDVRDKNFIRNGVFSGACYKCDWRSHCLGK